MLLLWCALLCSLDALRALMTPDVKCLVVNLPHNPSGWLPSRQQWQEIMDCARRVSVDQSLFCSPAMCYERIQHLLKLLINRCCFFPFAFSNKQRNADRYAPAG